jgi:DNA-binding CsgD family transcriptional regulator/plasmid maintenance system antidote protein VapI
MDEYRVKITVRNNLLLKAIEDAGYKSQSDFARAIGSTASKVNALVALRDPPLNSTGEFSDLAKLVMEALGACPTDLWTEQQLTMQLKKNSTDMKMGANMLQLMMSDPNDPILLENDVDDMNLFREELKDTMADLLDSMTPREAKVLKLRFGIGCEEHTLEQLAALFDVTRERIRQIEAKALRKMRHPSRSDGLKVFIDPEGYESPTVKGNRRAPNFEVMKKRYGHTPETARQYNNSYTRWVNNVVEAAKITEEARKKLRNDS